MWYTTKSNPMDQDHILLDEHSPLAIPHGPYSTYNTNSSERSVSRTHPPDIPNVPSSSSAAAVEESIPPAGLWHKLRALVAIRFMRIMMMMIKLMTMMTTAAMILLIVYRGYDWYDSKYHPFHPLQQTLLANSNHPPSSSQRHPKNHPMEQEIYDSLQSLQDNIDGQIYYYYHHPPPPPPPPAVWELDGTNDHHHHHHHHETNDDDINHDRQAFDKAAHVWNSRATCIPPMAVIEVAHEQDVLMTLPLLSHLYINYTIPFRIRSGGHHKAGYSSVGHGIVLSLAKMNRLIQFSADRIIEVPIRNEKSSTTTTVTTSTTATTTTSLPTAALATIEPGFKSGQVLLELLQDYGYGGVTGACTNVAEGGFVLGGGFGMMSRFYGLGCDQVTKLNVVLANGQLHTVLPGDDLFWALMGAGGGTFGVITSMDYKVYPTQDYWEVLSILVDHSPKDLSTLIFHIGSIEPSIPREITVMWDFVESTTHAHQVNFLVMGHGKQSTKKAMDYVQNEILPVVAESPHVSWTLANGSWTDWAKGTLTNSTVDWGVSAYAAQAWTGFLYPSNNTQDIWDDIVQTIVQGCEEAGEYLYPDIELWGGAISSVASDTTAFAHRSAVFNVGVLLIIPNGVSHAEAIYHEVVTKVNRWWPKVSKYLTGTYVNYPMVSLSSDEYPRAYWGNNLERLVRLKQKYDPWDVFSFEQSIPMNL